MNKIASISLIKNNNGLIDELDSNEYQLLNYKRAAQDENSNFPFYNGDEDLMQKVISYNIDNNYRNNGVRRSRRLRSPFASIYQFLTKTVKICICLSILFNIQKMF